MLRKEGRTACSHNWAPSSTPCLLFKSLLAKSLMMNYIKGLFHHMGTPGPSAALEWTPQLPPRQEMTRCGEVVQTETAPENEVTSLGNSEYKYQMLKKPEEWLELKNKKPRVWSQGSKMEKLHLGPNRWRVRGGQGAV